MLGAPLLLAPRRFCFGGGIGLQLPLLGDDRESGFFVFRRDATLGTFSMRFAQLPDTDGRQTGIPVGDLDVASREFIEKVQLADVTRVPVKTELPFVLRKLRMRSVDPWPQHIMVVVDVINDHAIALYGALNVGREVDAQEFFIQSTCGKSTPGFAFSTQQTFTPLLEW